MNYFTEANEVLDRWKKYVGELYELKNFSTSLPVEDEIYQLALKEIKNRKAAETDERPIEIIKNIGESAKKKLYR